MKILLLKNDDFGATNWSDRIGTLKVGMAAAIAVLELLDCAPGSLLLETPRRSCGISHNGIKTMNFSLKMPPVHPGFTA